MKHCLLTLAALLVAASTYAQGTVNFVNRIAGVLDAPVTIQGSGVKLEGSQGWVAQLWAAPANTTAWKVATPADPIAFRDGAGAGYWPGATRTLDGIDTTGALLVRVWNQKAFGTWDNAVLANAGFGESIPLPSVALGGGLNPPTPMTGLQGFTVVDVPEPSIAALGLLGLGLLLIRRKK